MRFVCVLLCVLSILGLYKCAIRVCGIVCSIYLRAIQVCDSGIWSKYSVQCILYIVHGTLYAVQCTAYTVRRMMYDLHVTLAEMANTLYNVAYHWIRSLYDVHSLLWFVQCTPYHCTQYAVQCTVYDVRCTVYSVRCTMYLSTSTTTLYR